MTSMWEILKRIFFGVIPYDHKKRSRNAKPTKKFFISDLHLNHRNIIKHCDRPFRNVNDMNNTIVRRWNSVVNKSDVVFHLGDFCMHGDKGKWIRKLHGHIIFVKGNHDLGLYNTRKQIIFHYYGKDGHCREDVLLQHTPQRPTWWGGWIIHGHVHNNDLNTHPLVNTHLKLINVSAEILNYYPIEENELFSRRSA